MDNVFKKLGNSIKQARLAMGYTQEQCAEIVEITPTHMKHIESGHRKPSIEVLFKLAQELHFSIDALLVAENTETAELQKHISLLLPQCTPNDLYVIEATLQAILKVKSSPTSTP